MKNVEKNHFKRSIFFTLKFFFKQKDFRLALDNNKPHYLNKEYHK